MTRRTLFQRAAAAFAGSVIARLPLAGATIELASAPVSASWIEHMGPLRVTGQPYLLIGFWDAVCPRCGRMACSSYVFSERDDILSSSVTERKEQAMQNLLDLIHGCECSR